MDLSLKETLILANQYEILKHLDPSRQKDYDLFLKCLYDGYLDDFDQLIGHFDVRLDPVVKQEVRDILEMFRALHPGQGITPPVVFAGFDGNEETESLRVRQILIGRSWPLARIEG